MDCPHCLNPVQVVEPRFGILACTPCRRRWISPGFQNVINVAAESYLSTLTFPDDVIQSDIQCGLCCGEGCVTCENTGRA
jgi:hypothetical protein